MKGARVVYKKDTESYYRVLGAKITLVREMRGIAQMKMAEKLNMSKANYSNIESGTNQIYAHTLTSIAEILEIKIHRLFERNI